MNSLLKNSRVWSFLDETTAGSTTLQSSKVVDMSGYDGLMLVANVDTVTAGGVARLQFMHSDSTSTTDMVSCTGTVAQTTSSTTDHQNQTLVLDVVQPTKRYGSVFFHRATQVCEPVVVGIQYNQVDLPTVQSTALNGVIASNTYIAPTT